LAPWSLHAGGHSQYHDLLLGDPVMKPKDVIKWKEADWKNKVKYAMPSSGGAIGVIFIWADKPPMGTKPKANTSSFVLKPVKGTAAPTKFAEMMLKKVAGALSPHTKGIKHTQDDSRNAGKFVEEMLLSFKKKEGNSDIKKRWEEVWPHYQTADSFLIQETQQGIQEFGDEYRTLWGLSTLLANDQLMENIGKLFVADAMIGNGDRLCSPNTGNIIFKGNNKVCSIDSATILTNYEAVKNDITTSSWVADEVTMNHQVWTKGIVKSGTNAVPSAADFKAYEQGLSPKVAPSFQIETMFNPAVWWEKVFKTHLQSGLAKNNISDQEPEDYEWDRGKISFLRGVEKGKKELDGKLSGLNWLMIKLNYKKYISKYGCDPNLDWTNFKVRRLYFKLRRKGLNQEQAMLHVNEYVKKKFHLIS
jgi:hypothetical protein